MKRRSKKKANQRRSDSLKGKERRTWCERESACMCVCPLEAWQKESICVCVCACGRERRRVGEQNCNFSFFPFQRFESPILERRHTATHVRGAKPRPIPCQKIGRGTKKSFISLSRHLSLSLSLTHTHTHVHVQKEEIGSHSHPFFPFQHLKAHQILNRRSSKMEKKRVRANQNQNRKTGSSRFFFQPLEKNAFLPFRALAIIRAILNQPHGCSTNNGEEPKMDVPSGSNNVLIADRPTCSTQLRALVRCVFWATVWQYWRLIHSVCT